MRLAKLKKQSRSNKKLPGIAFNMEVYRRPLCLLEPAAETVASLLIDVAPVFKVPLQYRLGHPVFQVANDMRSQPVPGGLVHHVADQRAGLPPVVIVGVLAVGGVHKLSA